MDANYDFMNSVGLKESDPPWLAETIKYPPAKEDMGDDPVDNHPTLIQHTVNLQATTRDPLDLTTSAEEPSWAETPSWAEVSKRFDEARDLQTSQLMEDGIDP